LQAKFAGDNFLRHSGDAPEVQRLQLFAWSSEQRGGDVHLQANPTAGELLHQEYKQTKETLKGKNKVSILDKYGGEEYLETAPRELLQGQTEDYVEYSRTGQVVKGLERAKARSKYREDGGPRCHVLSVHADLFCIVFTNNHTAVWGSWYNVSTGAWGYACCHSSILASYCAGRAGIEAARQSSASHLLAAPPTSSMPPPPVPAKARTGADEDEDEEAADDRRRRAETAFSKKRVGEGDVNIDRDRLERALNEERKRKAMRGEEDDAGAGKRRKGPRGGSSFEVSEEDMGMCADMLCDSPTDSLAEAYRMNRSNYEDPMANYVDKEL
jgi:pre-mRNA-processing factor SLU7